MAELFAKPVSPVHARASLNSNGSLATYPSLGLRMRAVLVWQLSLAVQRLRVADQNEFIEKPSYRPPQHLMSSMICFDVKINLNLNLCLLNLCLLNKIFFKQTKIMKNTTQLLAKYYEINYNA